MLDGLPLFEAPRFPGLDPVPLQLTETAAFEVIFTVPGDVVPWARSRINQKTGMPFTPGPQRNYAATVKRLAEEALAGRPVLEGAVELCIVATYLRPKSASKRNPPRWKTTLPDQDNISKLVSDSLNRIVYRDDGQVASAHVWKVYGDAPGLLIRVRSLV